MADPNAALVSLLNGAGGAGSPPSPTAGSSNVVPFPNAPGGTDAIVQRLMTQMQVPSSAPAISAIQQAGKEREVTQGKIAALPVPEPPTPQALPQPPIAQVTDFAKSLSPGLIMLAALGGALTRTPINNTVQALTGYAKGLHEGDVEATKNAYDRYDRELKTAIQTNQDKITQYNEAREKHGDNLQKLYDELNGIAAKSGDAAAIHQLQMGDFDAFYKANDAQLRLMEQLQNKAQQFDTQVGRAWGPVVQFQMKDGTTVQGQMNNLTHEIQGIDGSPIDRSELAGEQKLGVAPRSAPAMALQKFISDFPKMHGGRQPTADEVTKFSANYGEQVKAARDWGTGPLGNQTRSFNVGLYHLDTLQKLADDLKNNQMQAFNRLANEWAAQTGNPAPVNFETAKQIIGAEIVKAIVGAGGGGVAERMEAAQHVSSALSPEQIAGSIKTTEDLMVGQLRGLRDQYKRTTGGTDEEFEANFLSDEARDLFKSYKSGHQPEQSDLDYLRANDTPAMRAKFDANFGQGAAAKALGQ